MIPFFHALLLCACLLASVSLGVAQEIVPKATAVLSYEETLPAPFNPRDFAPSLHDAVLLNDETLVRNLLQAGYSVNAKTADGETALCAAMRNGFSQMALYLLLHGADPNLPGSDGQHPTALASLRRHPLLLKLLLAAGANPNVAFAYPLSKELLASVGDEYLRRELKVHKNVTPLMACSARGDVEAVTLLLSYKANRQAFTQPYSRYAINFAAAKQYLYIMRLLLGRDPESEPRVLITVNLTTQKARLEVEGKLVLEAPTSTGRKGYDTPAGRYVITNRYKSWVSTIYKVPMPYFLRLNCSAIGLHSGYVTGRPASHGCIRLSPKMAAKFFELTNVGDEVNIEY